MGQREDFAMFLPDLLFLSRQTWLGSSLSTIRHSHHNAVIRGDGSLPGTGPPSKFFWAVAGEVKSLS